VVLIERVADLLDEHSIAFALIGAAALATRGVARSTFDIDLLTVDTRVLKKLIWVPIQAEATVDVRRGDFDIHCAGSYALPQRRAAQST